MRIPELKDCGFGVPLALGAKIISLIFLSLSSITFIICVFYIIKFEIEERDSSSTDSQRQKETFKEVIAVMISIVAVIQGTLASLLWYGIKEHKPSFVLPWAILTAAFTVIFTFIELLVLIHTISWKSILFGLYVVLMYYFVLIIYSHFRELRREKNLPQALKNNDAEQ